MFRVKTFRQICFKYFLIFIQEISGDLVARFTNEVYYFFFSIYNQSNTVKGGTRHIVLDQNKSKWELVNLNTNESMVADATIGDGNQQLFTNFGFSVEVNQENPPAWDYLNNVANYDESNRLISSSIEFADEYNPWLGGVRDVDEEDGEVSKCCSKSCSLMIYYQHNP